MTRIHYKFHRISIALIVFFLSLSTISCIKNTNITTNELDFIFSEKDYSNNESIYKVLPLKSGDDYFYTKTKNQFGWYYLYSINFIDNKNNEIHLKTTINIFYSNKDILKLYKSNVLVNSNNEISDIELLKRFNFDKVCFINNENYKYISLISKNILYSIEIEGITEITLDELLEISSRKICIINNKDLLQYK